jgi:hypothetical protein
MFYSLFFIGVFHLIAELFSSKTILDIENSTFRFTQWKEINLFLKTEELEEALLFIIDLPFLYIHKFRLSCYSWLLIYDAFFETMIWLWYIYRLCYINSDW